MSVFDKVFFYLFRGSGFSVVFVGRDDFNSGRLLSVFFVFGFDFVLYDFIFLVVFTTVFVNIFIV